MALIKNRINVGLELSKEITNLGKVLIHLLPDACDFLIIVGQPCFLEKERGL